MLSRKLRSRTWLKDHCVCPLQVYPLNGPVEGGTHITIEGTNLGSAQRQVENAVTVGQGVCSVVSYDISKKYAYSQVTAQITKLQDNATTEHPRNFCGVACFAD